MKCNEDLIAAAMSAVEGHVGIGSLSRRKTVVEIIDVYRATCQKSERTDDEFTPERWKAKVIGLEEVLRTLVECGPLMCREDVELA